MSSVELSVILRSVRAFEQIKPTGIIQRLRKAAGNPRTFVKLRVDPEGVEHKALVNDESKPFTLEL
jgi:hypothetical protein